MKKWNGSLCAALVLGLGVLILVQALVVPKYTGVSRDGSLTGEYYGFAGGNDVLFVGDCEVYENFSPITLWENYGIPSAIRGSPQQMIWQSYYLLEDALRYETPKAVVFNVLSMKYDTPKSAGPASRREAYNRMTLDSMGWSSSKVSAIRASMTAEEKERNALWSYVFPLLRYHERWSELGKEDIQYLFGKEPISHNGYLMQAGIKPVEGEHVEPPLADYTLGENSWYYLDKMESLCREKGIQLILIKAPTLYPIWWDQWDEQVKAYAKEKGLMYLNFLECQEEVGIDWNRDTYDTGLHLNVYGAEKLTDYFGQILSRDCGLPDRRGDAALDTLWAEKSRRYYEEKKILEAQRDGGEAANENKEE